MTIRALVVDDEPLARRRLRRLLTEHEDIEVIAEATTGDEAVSAVLSHRPELVFLDVRMPGTDGLQAMRRLQTKLPEEVRPLTVFTTAYEEHAVEAFELEGTDYLVKPIGKQELGRALRRVRRELWQRGRAERGAEVEGSLAEAKGAAEIAATGEAKPLGHLAAHSAGKIIRLALDDVACLTVEDTIIWAHTADGRFRMRPSLGQLEERLACPPFFRASRSAIVNLGWIDHLAPMFSGTYSAYLRAPVGMEVHVSRRRARKLRQLLGW